jgi:glycosyltransferase involved in cell wall biosynthesis
MYFSVIIPTYNRVDSLRNILQALTKQNYPLDQFEVLVVDDGSKDDTSSIANEKFPFAFQYFRQTNQGATVARNHAADQARGDVLIFLDDDIAVVPEFISAFAAAHQQDRVVAVGNLHPVTREGMSIFEEIAAEDSSFPANPNGTDFQWVSFTDCLTGMFSVKRSHFYEIGKLLDLVGDGRVAWGDVDFGYRASLLGFKFMRCYKAVGYHDDFSIRDFDACARRWQRTSESVVKLFRVYPDIQPHVPMYIDKAPIRWDKDPMRLIGRKLLRQLMSSAPVMIVLKWLVAFTEKYYPSKNLLRPLYRWVMGGYMFHGFRDGLGKYNLLP